MTPSRASGVEPRTADEAWEALIADLAAGTRVGKMFGVIVARNRPLIEAALRQGTPEDGLDVERLTNAIDRWWNVDSETGERHGHPYPTLAIIPSMVARSIAREYAALPSTTEDPK